MAEFICPVCKAALCRSENTYACPNRHSFDIAKQRYVNLLMSSAKGKTHGDDKAMIRAREDFLSRGFYDTLSREVSTLAYLNCQYGGVVIDAGCGEGKYICDVLSYFEERGKAAEIIGIDISKDALKSAARRTKNIAFAVASVSDMPIAERSADVIINIFAPFEAREFSRVLKENGTVIRVYPLEKHLWELKSLIYETPYENPFMEMEEDGFEIAEKTALKYKMELACEDAKSLFAMTPYFYRTGEEDKEKLDRIEKLVCTAEFGIVVYKKK